MTSVSLLRIAHAGRAGFVMFIKVWFWLEMQTNRVLREVKRVELLIAARRAGE